tara:strand:- start:3578 stop:3844 length:267 start_codon:yes stop_codon:yes gene_type:complete
MSNVAVAIDFVVILMLAGILMMLAFIAYALARSLSERPGLDDEGQKIASGMLRVSRFVAQMSLFGTGLLVVVAIFGGLALGATWLEGL